MKIQKLSAAVGTLFIAAACHNEKPKVFLPPVERAYEYACRNLSRDEIQILDRNAEKQIMDYTSDVSDKIVYWDSAYAVKRVAQAFERGKQYIKDSINGKNYPEPKFHIPFDTVINRLARGSLIVSDTKHRLSELCSPEEIFKLYQNEPPSKPYNILYSEKATQKNHLTHYYSIIGMKAAERQAFIDGKNSVYTDGIFKGTDK